MINDAQTQNSFRYGDRAGEHLKMRRGKYQSWFYVLLSFIGSILILDAIWIYLRVSVFDTIFASIPDYGILTIYIVCFALSIAVSIWMYFDRWWVNEAFSSRFCSGWANWSVLYVPFISLGYAVYRAARKIKRT